MALPWIKVEHATLTKPEIFEIARILGVSTEAAFYMCMKFWAWMDNASVDGSVRFLSSRGVDEIVSRSGFCEAMAVVGWIVIDGEHASTVPNFTRHNGDSAKKRALNTKNTEMRRGLSSVCPPTVLDLSSNCPPTKRTKSVPDKIRGEEIREDKTRGENNNTNNVRRLRDDVVFSAPPLQATQTSQTATPTHFDAFWDACPRVRRRDKGGAKKAYDAAVKRLAGVCADPHTFLLARMTAYAASPLGQGQYSKMPSSWLIKCSYDDDDSQWRALDRPLTTAEHNRNFFDDLKQEIINGHDAGNDSRQTEPPIHRIQRQGDA